MDSNWQGPGNHATALIANFKGHALSRHIGMPCVKHIMCALAAQTAQRSCWFFTCSLQNLANKQLIKYIWVQSGHNRRELTFSLVKYKSFAAYNAGAARFFSSSIINLTRQAGLDVSHKTCRLDVRVASAHDETKPPQRQKWTRIETWLAPATSCNSP